MNREFIKKTLPFLNKNEDANEAPWWKTKQFLLLYSIKFMQKLMANLVVVRWINGAEGTCKFHIRLKDSFQN